MPTYEYECQQCGEQFEYFHGISEPAKTTCEKCGGALTKLLSPGAGLIFKGSGFYITDYKKGDSGSGASSSSSEKKAESSDTGSKSESTPKTETKPATSSESTSTTKKAD